MHYWGGEGFRWGFGRNPDFWGVLGVKRGGFWEWGSGRGLRGWKQGLGGGWCRCGGDEFTLRVMDGLDWERLCWCVERAVRGGERGEREERLDWIWMNHWKSKRRWGRDGGDGWRGMENEMGGKGNGIRNSERDWLSELVLSGDWIERWDGERNRRFGVIWG